jgi:hypothetical protein
MRDEHATSLGGRNEGARPADVPHDAGGVRAARRLSRREAKRLRRKVTRSALVGPTATPTPTSSCVEWRAAERVATRGGPTGVDRRRRPRAATQPPP